MASTGVTPRQSVAFRKGIIDGRPVTSKEREQLLKPFLPAPPPTSPTRSKAPIEKIEKAGLKPKVGPIRNLIYFVVYTIIAFIFSVFFRFRRAWRLVKSKIVALLKYHHRTPEFIQRDVKHLDRLPQHLSVILDLHDNDEDQGSAGLEGLVNDVCEIAAWTASAGIPFLSVYEKTGRWTDHFSFPNALVLTMDREIEGLHTTNPPQRLPDLRGLFRRTTQAQSLGQSSTYPVVFASSHAPYEGCHAAQ